MAIGAQTQMFFYALALGGLVGVAYDVCRVIRRAFSHSWAMVLLEDMLFFALCTVVLFRYFMELGGGEVRLFAVAGLLLGWVIYFFTLGSIVMKLSGVIIDFIRRIWKAITVPVSKAVKCLSKSINKASKPVIRQKNRLKSSLYMLYNKHIRLPPKRTAKEGSAKWHTSKKKKKKNVPP